MTEKKQKLEDMLLDKNVKLSIILEHAREFANEHDKKAVPWITQEMNGYASAEECPEYREVSGEIKIRHESGKWMPCGFPSFLDAENRESLLHLRVCDSVTMLEENIDKNGISAKLPIKYPEPLQGALVYFFDKPGYEFFLAVSGIEAFAVLEKARSNLLNWISALNTSVNIFPEEILPQLPNEVRMLIKDFNFNYSYNQATACMLLLRKILPLSIVKKFELDGIEQKIKKNGEYVGTKSLIEQANSLIPTVTPRTYRSLSASKILLDASQHSYTFNPHNSDVKETATTLRLFLEELFPRGRGGP